VLSYPPLEQDSIHLRVYADASFSSNDDLSSQLCYIILLCDRDAKFHVLAYSSKKARHVV